MDKRLIFKYVAGFLALLVLLFAVFAVGRNARKDTSEQVGRAAAQSAQILYENALAGCHRGNILRRESNERAKEHKIELHVLRGFLKDARKARQQAYEIDKKKFNLRAVERYTKRLQELEPLSFDKVELVKCKQVIRKPNV